MLSVVQATIIKPNQALRLRAKSSFVDRFGNSHKTAEEWLVGRVGAFIPSTLEEVVGVIDGIVLSETQSIHLRAQNTFHDVFGREHKTGEEWIVTRQDCD